MTVLLRLVSYVVILVSLLSNGAQAYASDGLSSTLPVTSVAAPHECLAVEIATTQAEREHGLMGRTSLAPHAGMLFVFPKPGMQRFWMKDTLFSLDMVFLSSTWKVATIAAGVPVPTYRSTDARIPTRSGFAQYVLELNAGEAARAGLFPGIQVTTPRLDHCPRTESAEKRAY